MCWVVIAPIPFGAETMPGWASGRQDRDVLKHEASVPGSVAGLSAMRREADD
jgi:hypothetical protein